MFIKNKTKIYTREKMVASEIEKAKELIDGKFACIQTAPSLRVALGEAFGMEPGQNVEGKLVAALHMLGFKRVFETDFGAELRVMEESAELKERLEKNHLLPMMTSCCPSWAGICVKMYPDIIPYLSTCKSPMEMVSSFAKDYLTHERNFGDITVTAVMPCFAKKMEVRKGQTDLVLTAMELVNWIKSEGIDFANLKDGFFDAPLGMTSSAGTIYASTGGVMEATLRTFTAMYGGGCDAREHLYEEKIIGEGIREKILKCGDSELKVGMVEGAKGIHEFCKGFLDGKYRDFHMVEMMFCSGGCVGGPGMPNPGQAEFISKRIRALTHYDDNAVIKGAHENPLIKQLYKDYIGKPFGKKSKEVLHVKDFNVMFG
jgi:NADH-quinone oxidoreductase subunit G